NTNSPYIYLQGAVIPDLPRVGRSSLFCNLHVVKFNVINILSVVCGRLTSNLCWILLMLSGST
ncbi:hypothetical protein LSH36_191g04106, partial [Paralvinella palmiformis]